MCRKSFSIFRDHYIEIALTLSISILVFQSKQSFAFQQKEYIEFEKFSPEVGLASNDVWNVIQDYKGLMWIATEGGLNQYDGYTIKLYTHDKLDSNSLGYNQMRFLYEDRQKNLWVCTRGGGLNLYNRELDNFYIFKHIEGDSSSISGNNINSIIQDSDGTYWVTSSANGVCSFQYAPNDDPYSIKFQRHAEIELTGDPSRPLILSTITEDQHKNIWIATDDQGVFILHRDSTTTKFQNDPADPSSLSSNNTSSILCDTKNRIWISTWDGGLNLYEPGSSSFIHYRATEDPTSICNNQIWTVQESNGGEIWIGTDTGLNRFEDASKAIPDNKFRRYVHNPDDDKSLGSDIIQSLYFDNQDRLWVSTLQGGINVWDKSKQKFHPIRHQKENPTSLNGNTVRAFVEDTQGNIWIGTDGGGLNLKKEPDSFFDNQFINFVNDPRNPLSLAGDKILSLSIDSKDGIWIGTWVTGLDYFTPNDQIFKHFKHNPNDSNSISSNEIFTLAVDNNDNLWIGTYRAGLNFYNKQTRKFSRYYHDPTTHGSIGSNMISTLLIDGNNKLWVGTDEGGLNLFDTESGTFKKYTNPDKTDFRQYVNCLYRDEKDKLWVSFYGFGLFYLDEEEDKLIKVDVLEDRHLVVNGILGDGEQLWLSTTHGLVLYNTNSNKTLYFDKKDGIQDNHFMRESALKTSTGTLLFGGIKGFNAINPQDITFNAVPPPIIFTDITINDQAVGIGKGSPLKKHISELEHLVLEYDQNSFSISFAALNYTLPEKNQFSYILEGFHEGWVNPKNENKVVFTNLDPDVYTLRVKASNNDGVWNEEGIKLNIEIQPPWWGTIWFKFSIIVISILGGTTVMNIRTRYLERQRVELKRIIAEKTNELNERLEEISTQNIELNEQKNEIFSQNNQLEAYNEELTTQHEHVYAQNEKMDEQYRALQEFQLQISSINESLENKVIERTKKLDETISELNKTVSELDRFVYSASHDLSSPLKSILGLVHIANLENKNDRIHEYLEYIESSIHKLEEVIKNLVQFSRNNRLDIRIKKIKLKALVQEVIKELKFMPEAEYLKINIDIPDDFLVESDYQRLKVVLHNLIGNAIKYSDQEKTEKKITVSHNSNGNKWGLTIEDNGIGIDEDNLGHVFDMFFRATEKSTGSGLGLFIVQETMKRLKGTISVNSTLGVGSFFHLNFEYFINED